ncbi:hypothetical protein B0H10DRAFT_1945249 [Mycena sp. CBHHK59/15]|nr:hypothetical protein B0H10DRAFT_1945249 [Mycena sp. CBHHK59/15]
MGIVDLRREHPVHGLGGRGLCGAAGAGAVLGGVGAALDGCEGGAQCGMGGASDNGLVKPLEKCGKAGAASSVLPVIVIRGKAWVGAVGVGFIDERRGVGVDMWDA